MNKDYIIGFLVLVLLLVAGCNACRIAKERKAKGQKEEVIRTKVERDTVTVHDTTRSVSYVPKPYEVVHYKTVVNQLPGISVPVDTAAILKDYTAKVYYKDSFLTKYGKTFINDTVQFNRIAGRSWQADFSIPTITNTITNTVKVKGRPKKWGIGINVGYGLSVPDYKHPFQNTKLAPYVGVGLSYNLIRF